MLEPYRHAHQAGGDADAGLFVGIEAGVGRTRRVTQQRFWPTERCRDPHEPDPIQQARNRRLPALEFEGQHTAEMAHLATSQVVLRMRRHARMMHRLHPGDGDQRTHDMLGRLDLSRHAHCQRADTAKPVQGVVR